VPLPGIFIAAHIKEINEVISGMGMLAMLVRLPRHGAVDRSHFKSLLFKLLAPDFTFWSLG
jgi:hypothetical protein